MGRLRGGTEGRTLKHVPELTTGFSVLPVPSSGPIEPSPTVNSEARNVPIAHASESEPIAASTTRRFLHNHVDCRCDRGLDHDLALQSSTPCRSYFEYDDAGIIQRPNVPLFQ